MGTIMKNFISDEEMAKLEQKGVAKPMEAKGDFISDDEMNKLSESGAAQDYQPKKRINHGFADGPLMDSMRQGITFGYGPQVEAGVDWLVHKLGGFDDDLLDPYTERRDKAIKRYKQHADENPGLWAGGQIAGGILGAIPATSLAAAKGLNLAANATKGARLARAGGTGAGLGFLTNPGDKEGELSGLQMKDRLTNAGIGAGTGLFAQGGMEALSKLAKKSGGLLKDFAEKKAVKATGALKKGLAEVDERGMTNRLGRSLLDEKVVTPLSTPADISKRLQPLINESMDEVDNLILKSSLSGNNKINAQTLKTGVKNEIRKKFKGVPSEKIQNILDEVDGWFPKREMTVLEAQEAKQGMNQFLTDRNFLQQNPSGKTQAMLGVRKGLKEGVEGKVDEIAGQIGSKAGALKKANQRAGDFITAKDLADDGNIRQAANRIFGLSEQLGALGGLGSGGSILDKGLTGLGLAAASRGLKTHGNSLAATGADKVSKFISNPKLLDAIKNKPELVQSVMNRTMGPALTNFEEADDDVYANSSVFKMIEKNPALVNNIQDEKLRSQMEEYLEGRPSFTKHKIDEQESRNQYIENN